MLAASGVGSNILLFRYEWNEWLEDQVADTLGKRNEAPSFVSWSPEQSEHSFLLFGQGDIIATFSYNSVKDSIRLKQC